MTFDEVCKAVVKITDGDGTIRGTGFFVTPDGHVLTNYHVINGVGETSLRVEFDRAYRPVTFIHLSEQKDFGLLKIDCAPTPYCSLDSVWKEGDQVRSYGYHRAQQFPNGFPVAGIIVGSATLEMRGHRHDVIALKDVQATSGLSGGPAYNDRTGAVIGIVSFQDGEHNGLAIPITVVVDNSPTLKSLLPYDEEQRTSFKHDVETLYKLLGYRTTPGVPIDGGAAVADLLLEFQPPASKLAILSIVGLDYRPKGELVDRDSATAFMRLFRTAQTSLGARSGVLVTNSGFSLEAKLVIQSGGGVIEMQTYSDLLRSLVNVDSYIDTLIFQYEHFDESRHGAMIDLMARDDLFKYYVPLNARDANGQWQGSLDDFVQRWLLDRDRQHLSILGDYGTGKSAFCLKLVYSLAKQYRNDPLRNRIPIFISLKAHRGEADVQKIITDLFATRYDIKLASILAFRRLLEAGKFVLVFDGFDEMASPTDPLRTSRNLNTLNDLAIGDNKIILTCRTHYFTTQREAARTLAPEHDTSLMRMIRARPNATILLLDELSEAQIEEYLRKHTPDWRHILKTIDGTYDLRDLARRPLLLRMIFETADQLVHENFVGAADLYRKYTAIWIERDDWRAMMTPEAKAKLMEELAFVMFSQEERQSIHYTELARPIHDYFKNRILPAAEDAYENDVRTCSFLNRDDDGYYRFIHKSFMEYFVARKLLAELVADDYRNFDKQRISVEIAGFLCPLLGAESAIGDSDFRKWIDDTKGGRTFADVGYHATNAVMLLRQARRNDLFKAADFRGAVLRGADLGDLDLTRTDFSGSDLRTATFNHSVLVDAVFRDARLTDVALGENNAMIGLDINAAGTQLAVCGSGGTITLYDMSTQKHLATLSGHANSVKSVAYSTDGVHLVSGGIDGSVRVWDASTLLELIRLRGHQEGVRTVAYSPTGNFVASGSFDATVRLWSIDVQNRIGREIRCLKGHSGRVYSIAIDSAGGMLASGGGDGRIYIWDVERGRPVHRLLQTAPVHAVALSHNGKLLAAGVGQDRVHLWDLQNLTEVAVYSAHTALIFSVCFSQDDRYVVSGDQDGRIVVWDLQSSSICWVNANAHLGVVNALKFINNGKRFASVSEDGTLKFWDLERPSHSPLATVGRPEDLRIKGMQIAGATGLSEARIAFLKSKGAVGQVRGGSDELPTTVI